jgi:hypothetical protein
MIHLLMKQDFTKDAKTGREGKGGGLLGQLPPFALFALYKKQGKPTVPLSSSFHTPKIRNV